MNSDPHNTPDPGSWGFSKGGSFSNTGSWGLSKPTGLTDDWPKQDDGTLVPPAFLTHKTALNLEAELLSNMLGAYAIPVLCRYPNNGEFGKVIIGMSGGGVDLYVPETLLADAKALMEEEGEHEL